MSMVGAGAMPGFRTPPHNVEAEQALLGAILISNDAYPCVARFLRPEHFYEPVHGRIYAAMAAVIERGGIADRSSSPGSSARTRRCASSTAPSTSPASPAPPRPSSTPRTTAATSTTSPSSVA
jgi:DnaB-like helicase N terminal domain